MFYIKQIKDGNTRLIAAKHVEIQSVMIAGEFSKQKQAINIWDFEKNFYKDIKSELGDRLSHDVEIYTCDLDMKKLQKNGLKICGLMDVLVIVDADDIKQIILPSQCAYVTNDKGATLHSIRNHIAIHDDNESESVVFGTNNC